MAGRFRSRIALTRFLVEADELALAVLADPDGFARVSQGRVTAQTAQELRERVGAVRVLEHERRATRFTNARQAARDACAEVADVARLARSVARLHGHQALEARLDELRREHPLRARTVTVVACSLEAYAGVLRTHASELAGVVPAECAERLDSMARELRARLATQRQERLESMQRTAERDARLIGIDATVRAIRVAAVMRRQSA